MIDEDLQLYHSKEAERKGIEFDSNFYESLAINNIITFEKIDYKVVDFKIRIDDTWNNFTIYVERVEKK